MKDKLLRKSPFQLTFLFVFAFVSSLMMASNANINLSLEDSYTSNYALLNFSDNCEANAGTMSNTNSGFGLTNGSADLEATPNNDAVIPENYQQIFVLTQGEGLVIVNAGAEASFTVTESGYYAIHSFVYNPDVLDLSQIQFGQTTGFDIFGLLIEGGGKFCASLDVAGAKFKIGGNTCTADAGTMSTDMPQVELSNGSATIMAMANGNAVIPEGYAQAFVLTEGEGLIILNYAFEPSFEVMEAGNYTIHSLVLDPNTLDVTTIVPGVTTGFDVFGLLIAGGGEICASLDVAGAPIKVDEAQCTADAGTMYSSHPLSCINDQGFASISAMQNNAAVIPEGYSQIFVLTSAFDLVILDASGTPEFDINHPGFYRIHSLVYNPETLDLGIVNFGSTTGFDVLDIVGQNDICTSLDVHGAINLVLPKWICHFFSGSNYRVDQNMMVDNFISEFDSYEAFEASMSEDKLDVKVYPNPVVDNLFVKADIIEDEKLTYTIVDISGRIMASGTTTSVMNSRDISINTSNLNEGTYFVKFDSKYRSFTKAIQVSK
ncbi:T9SS type A sorting domain-containing protein [Psychroserpens sp.]|uniref:T9SS type A sorting domain-containing protein n=1 Tax=Psychroserpens sp. TaxID=2020870 RepID=UPI00385C11DC